MTTSISPPASHGGAGGSTRPAWFRWWVPAVCAAASLPLIVLFGPDYGRLQEAPDADALRAIVGEDRWRYAVAAAMDVVFAASYGLAAFAISKRVGLARWAPVAVVLGAVFDEIENIFVFVNVLLADSIGSKTVDAMRVFGRLKTWALWIGILALLAGAALRLWRGRDDPVTVPEETRRNGALALWFTLLVLALAVFAGAVRIDAPALALVALGLACIYALGRLSAADRRATENLPEDRREGRLAMVFVLVALIAITFMAASVVADVPDEWGFAALGAALYALVRSVDHARRRLWGFWRLRVALLITAVVGVVVTLAPIDWVRVVGAGVTVLAGAAAVELWSASFPPKLSENRLAAGIAGVALLAGVTVLLLFVNHDPVITSIVVAAVGVATALLITSNDMPILLGVLLLATLWSSVPRDATLPAGQELARGQPYFAVLGDSYISGEGTDTYFQGTNTTEEDGNQCRRSPDAWPILLNPPQTHDTGALLGVPERVANWACSGAVTADIRQVGDNSDGRDEPEQLAALKKDMKRFGPPSFVLVGIGGNDAQFADIGAACALPGDCADFLEHVENARLSAVADEVARTHAEIRIAVGPDVPVIAVPYPKPLYVGEFCRGVLLSEADIVAINRFAAALNGEIERAVWAVGARYMDTIQDGLADSAAQLCEPNERSGLNFADFNPKAGSLWSALNPKNWTHNFVHPNEGGHAALRAAALRWFTENHCVLKGACEPVSITAEIRRLANENVKLPGDVENNAVAAVADVVPLAVFVLGLLTAAWWLLITAVLGWQGVVRRDAVVLVRPRPRSSIERTVQLTSPGDDPMDG